MRALFDRGFQKPGDVENRLGFLGRTTRSVTAGRSRPGHIVSNVLQHRIPGAPLFSLELSERKAYTSALVRLRMADLVPLVQPGQPLYRRQGDGSGLRLRRMERKLSLSGACPLSVAGVISPSRRLNFMLCVLQNR